MQSIGPLIIVEGPKNSKVPFSRSLYLNCDEKVLIDTGANPKDLLKVEEEYGVKLILNTHYHPDHTQHNHLFPNAEKWMNPIEYETARTIEGIARSNGVYQEWGEEGIKLWKENLPLEWIQNLGEISGTYDYETEYSFGGIKVIMLHTPGHTSGLASPYFPDLGVAFVSDYDMTAFGPWYNGTDGDIEDFIKSGERLLELDADTYITGHQKGVFSKQEFKEAMKRYLAIINKRDEKIENYVSKGFTFDELSRVGIFYPKRTLEIPIFRTWERGGIRKHLQRLGIIISETDGALVSCR
ncbi:MBL fold metallo-hydrolase [Litchfieldia alkalitelluris]|uniref:MBL fold metallo-hydrolase n=1 Tax=Litchfieldia alkalitelluris TaxID=304268 RepID=UPI0009968015|nr:MBL fold metallo-hydrolase [Litchfieldia alkalitelluris]